MLAGLLFAYQDSEDRADRLVATLPFAGSSLIEHQGRQLVAAGASQLVVVAPRLTPELLGALSRLGRPGVAVDTVRSAGEAAAKLHPLARVLMLAEGLVATDQAVAELARDGGDALLVLDVDQAGRDFERVGGRLAWGGVARLGPQRIVEVSALPRDYDMQSALVRVLEQGGAAHVAMTGDPARYGHGLARSERVAAERGRRVLASFFAGKQNWFDRWMAAPAAQAILPPLVVRGVSGVVVGTATVALTIAAALALSGGHGAFGTVLALFATLLATVGVTLASLRGEKRIGHWQSGAAVAIPLGAALLLGWSAHSDSSDGGPLVTAIGVVILAALGERAIRQRARWWGSPGAYLLTAALGAAVGRPAVGLGAAAIYAAATLAMAIEDWRRQA